METYTAIKPRMNFSIFTEAVNSANLSGDLGGTTLPPGMYNATEAIRVQEGDLTLDAKGDENAVWIFQFDADFSTIGGSGGNVILTGKAKAQNVFWQTEHLVKIGAGTSFKGNILAKMVDVQEIHTAQPVSRELGKTQFKKIPSNMGWPLSGQRL
jgi:hypothetical protein